MYIKQLKADSHDLRITYFYYFILQAPYSYVGNWGYQIIYWMVAGPLYACIFSLFGVGVETELGFLDVMGLLVMAVLFSIWPVNMFFALPNLVKKENLRLYEIMKNKE
tara:strand:- start:1508 stop:1831 length:324 start_codon:yes stop_codon:yes gene_type:complete